MKTWILGTTVTVGLCANALATSSHLVYHCTFDDMAAIASPVVGEAGTKSAGKFVTGKIGNALQVPAYTQAVRVPFSNGLPVGKGRIEFYGRIDSGRTEFYDYDDPSFFGFHTQNSIEQHGNASISMSFTANDGAANSGLGVNLCGYPHKMSQSGYAGSYPYSCVMGSADPAAWHHYAIVWNTNGIASISGSPAMAVLFDDKMLFSQGVSAVNFKSHANGMLAIRSLTFTVDTTRSRAPYSIDEFKVWDTDEVVTPEPIPATPVIKPTSGTTFDTSLTVSMSCASDCATIHYTTDGSTPTLESPVYKKKFRIYGMTTVKAIAFYEDGTPSEMTVSAYAKGDCATPEIAAAETFTGNKNKVTISCATEGAAIYYTLDGSEPTTQSPRYEKPFCVTGSCMVKAIAVKDEFFDSDKVSLTVTREWSIGETMGKSDHVFETSGNLGFVRVEDVTAALGESMKSGEIGDGQKSVLSTVVVGSGTLTFKWKTSCEEDEQHKWDRAEFVVDGKVKKVLDGITEWHEVTHEITGEGNHTVIWRYVKDSEEKEGEDCLWVSEYSWKSDYTETQTTDIPVPYDWLTKKCCDVVDEYDSYESVAKQKALNKRLTVEQCYVAGIDPESTTNDFTTTITMVDGVPSITWNPDLETERTYKIWGSTNLVNGGDWEWPTNALHRFFKVTVEMP